MVSNDQNIAQGKSVTQNFRSVDSSMLYIAVILIASGVLCFCVLLWWLSVFVVAPFVGASNQSAERTRELVVEFKQMNDNSLKIITWIEQHRDEMGKVHNDATVFLNKIKSLGGVPDKKSADIKKDQ